MGAWPLERVVFALAGSMTASLLLERPAGIDRRCRP